MFKFGFFLIYQLCVFNNLDMINGNFLHVNFIKKINNLKKGLMMFVDAQFNTLREIPLPVKKKDEEKPVKLSLTPLESNYIDFMSLVIQQAIKEKSTLILLGASTKMEIDFLNWLKKIKKFKNFRLKDLDLYNLINKIWMKSNAILENRLKASDKAAFEDEESIKKESIQEAFINVPGKLFTLRQANLLLEIKGTNIDKTKCLSPHDKSFSKILII
jgi:hypothetical protein